MATPKDDTLTSSADASTDTTAVTPAIKIFVLMDDNSICFSMKPYTQLGKMMNAFYKKTGKTNVRFMYCGRKVEPDDTPLSLAMDDSDIIDAILVTSLGSGILYEDFINSSHSM